MTFSTVKNPYAVRTTDPLKIELYKAWDGTSLSNYVQANTTFNIDSTKFTTSDLPLNSMSADITTV